MVWKIDIYFYHQFLLIPQFLAHPDIPNQASGQLCQKPLQEHRQWFDQVFDIYQRQELTIFGNDHQKLKVVNKERQRKILMMMLESYEEPENDILDHEELWNLIK